jgi:hypothetical protein
VDEQEQETSEMSVTVGRKVRYKIARGHQVGEVVAVEGDMVTIKTPKGAQIRRQRANLSKP